MILMRMDDLSAGLPDWLQLTLADLLRSSLDLLTNKFHVDDAKPNAYRVRANI